MANLLCDDIYEKIFITLDVRTLIRCKRVCKSWKSFISGSRFVKAHLKRSCYRNENRHKRIGEAVFRITDVSLRLKNAIIGSSNGLVCISDGFDRNNGHLIVGNPSTREVRTVTTPWTSFSCSGFGYDSLTDDYKVVLGNKTFYHKTCFQVFSLKSNAWKVIGDVNYTCFERQPRGVLCNGAIHWLMYPKSTTPKKQVILSFDLSKEEFNEIPQPVMKKYNDIQSWEMKKSNALRVGIMEECLCVYHRPRLHPTMVMKNYNDIHSWEMLPDNCQFKFDYASYFIEVRHDMSRPRCWFIGNRKFSGGPNIVESLVSPHLLVENE